MLDTQAASALGEEGFEVLLDVPEEQIDVLIAGLTRVFKDDPRPPVVTINRSLRSCGGPFS
ncbi:MAG TPA: hypothetical protein VFZ66_20995 [Herpetosiphonaceae bacterium]